MEYSNDINYLSALEMLVNKYDATFPFIEKDITKFGNYYIINLGTKNLFAGDILDHFVIEASGIQEVVIDIDDNMVYSEIFDYPEEIVIKPFKEGLFTVSCDKSVVKMYITCDSVPVVQSMYTLLDIGERRKYWRMKTSFNGGLTYMDGYVGLIHGNYDRYCR